LIASRDWVNPGVERAELLASEITQAFDHARWMHHAAPVIKRVLYDYGPHHGHPEGISISDASIIHITHPRDSEAAMLFAEHAQWAKREAMKSLALASRDAYDAAEAANRANSAVMKALQRPSASFPVYAEKKLPLEPFRAEAEEEPGPHGLLRAKPPEDVDLHAIEKWLEKYPAPPVGKLVPRIEGASEAENEEVVLAGEEPSAEAGGEAELSAQREEYRGFGETGTPVPFTTEPKDMKEAKASCLLALAAAPRAELLHLGARKRRRRRSLQGFLVGPAPRSSTLRW